MLISTRFARCFSQAGTEEAHTLAELALFGMPNNQSAYQQLANVTLLFGGQHEEHAEDYRRELDLETAS